MTEQCMDTYRQMLNIRDGADLPPQLIVKYDKFKKLLDRVDGRLNAQGMAVVAVMAGFDLDADEFPGADTIDDSDEDGPMGEETEKMAEQVKQEMQPGAIDPPEGVEPEKPDLKSDGSLPEPEKTTEEEKTTAVDPPVEGASDYVEGMTLNVFHENRVASVIYLGMEDGKCKVRLQDGSELLFEEHNVTIPE